MKRGDIVLAALPKLGEPRPALIVQSDLFAELPTVSVLPLTG
ncbi:MAG: type II toxin-antitoxin system PemK/MazF family toxin, partial [Dongiaceae bacterium]